jgi:hypothetical protein
MEKLQLLLLPLLTATWWIAHWKHIVIFLCLIYFIRVIAKRDEIMSEAKRGVLTLPGMVTTIINDAIVIGIFTFVQRF